jgi:hypothetical protein
MKSIKIIAVFLAVCLAICILAKLTIPSLTPWARTLGWHFVNGNKVKFENISLTLPYRWWVFKCDQEVLVLTAAPPRGVDFYGIVSIRKAQINHDHFLQLKESKIIDQDSVIFEREIKNKIGGDDAMGLCFCATNTKQDGCSRNYLVFIIPKREIMIKAISIPKDGMILFQQLLNKISFVD